MQDDYEELDESDDDLQDNQIEGSDEGELSAVDRNVTLEKSDRSLSEFNRWYQKGKIIVDPEWQRQYVWDTARASKLIESFLLNIPVPVIYLAKRENDEKYEVIDGLQRLTSVFKYFNNEFFLRKLDVLKELNGKTFQNLSDTYQSKLEDAILRSFELSSGSSDMRFIVFERLNTGGIKLNDMEIRNCLYRGSLNTLIKELSTNSDFKNAINQKGLEKRMHDRALVLRFLAFYEKTHIKCTFGLKKFLNDYLEDYAKKETSAVKIEEYRKKFNHCMKACVTVFGYAAFRLKNDTGTKNVGEWANRPNAAIFQVVSTSFAGYDLGQVTRAADAIYEAYIDLINTDALWVDYVRRATGEHSRLKYAFETWNKRLEEVLNNYQPNDRKRIFSRQLKTEMFQQNQTCALCGQQIKLIDDAALDHDKRYWLGGQTIPDNAQLVHRLCNLKKG